MNRFHILATCLLAWFCTQANGQTGIITTVAGNGTCCVYGDGGPATAAAVWTPAGLAVDSSGNLYIVQENYNRVRVVTPDGIISTLAGGGNAGLGDGGPANKAQLSGPWGVAVDGSGNVYIADYFDARIRRVSGGIITTVAGGGNQVFNNGVPATSVGICAPYDVAVDASGNFFFTECSVDMVSPGGGISRVAGTGLLTGSLANGVPATNALLSNTGGIATDASGSIFFSEQDYGSGKYVVRKFTVGGTITTIAGGGNLGGTLADGGPATSANFGQVFGLAVDGTGNLFLASGGLVRKVTTGGVITTVAGGGTLGGTSGDGGPATSANLGGPDGLALDAMGNLYISESNGALVRKVALVGAPSTPPTCQPSLGTTSITAKMMVDAAASTPTLQVKLVLPPPNDEYAITAIPVPQMPIVQAQAQIIGVCPDPTPNTTFSWSATLKINENGGDGIEADYSDHIIQNQVTTGSNPYTLTFDDPNAFYGGDLTLTATAMVNGQTISGSTPDDLVIDGTNPDRSAVQLQTILDVPNRSFYGLNNSNVEDVLQRIACRESGPAPLGQTQFNAPTDGGVGPPIVAPDNGIGIFQITPTANGPDLFITQPSLVFDWIANVAAGVSTYQSKVKLSLTYPSALRGDSDTIADPDQDSYGYYIRNTINPTRAAMGLAPLTTLPAPNFSTASDIGSNPPNQLLEDAVRGYNGFSGVFPFDISPQILHEFVPNASFLLTVADAQLPTLSSNANVWMRVCSQPGNGVLYGPVGSDDCSESRSSSNGTVAGDPVYVNNVAANSAQCPQGAKGN